MKTHFAKNLPKIDRLQSSRACLPRLLYLTDLGWIPDSMLSEVTRASLDIALRRGCCLVMSKDLQGSARHCKAVEEAGSHF
jgi:hypothetical protein